MFLPSYISNILVPVHVLFFLDLSIIHVALFFHWFPFSFTIIHTRLSFVFLISIFSYQLIFYFTSFYFCVCPPHFLLLSFSSFLFVPSLPSLQFPFLVPLSAVVPFIPIPFYLCLYLFCVFHLISSLTTHPPHFHPSSLSSRCFFLFFFFFLSSSPLLCSCLQPMEVLSPPPLLI